MLCRRDTNRNPFSNRHNGSSDGYFKMSMLENPWAHIETSFASETAPGLATSILPTSQAASEILSPDACEVPVPLELDIDDI